MVPLLAARGEACEPRPIHADAGGGAGTEANARVVANARRLARGHGMDPDLAARIYRAMMAAAFSEDEMVVHGRRRGARRKGRSG